MGVKVLGGGMLRDGICGMGVPKWCVGGNYGGGRQDGSGGQNKFYFKITTRFGSI